MTQSTQHYALVVDDDPLVLMDSVCILEDAGFTSHEAMNGDEARVVLEEHWESITLLFSDVDMPGSMNGYALAHHVAEHWPAIEIVIASGHVLPAAGDAPDKATFIAKPFNRHAVHGHLNRVLPEHKKPKFLKTVS
ncbi:MULTISPECIES: response regulator [unclassified Sphingomonas]|uniref:response regulator n=1 Tax=unclassified Sphingomonas TaxID=196159 RepID=UPI002269E537|nr:MULTISPECIES: response regulator [unclassified Sphingomonas]